MSKSNKAFFVITIILTIYFDIFFITRSFLFYNLKETLSCSLYIFVPLILILIIYFFCNRNNSIKLNINYVFFIFSILFFIFINLYYMCYAFVISYNFNTKIALLLCLISAILLFLSFYKNFEMNRNSIKYIYITLFFIATQFLFLVFVNFVSYDSIKVSNPNRYKFVKYHFYSSSELASFPEEIPRNALNIFFQYIEFTDNTLRRFEYHKSLRLEFDIKTSENKIQHFEYYESNK